METLRVSTCAAVSMAGPRRHSWNLPLQAGRRDRRAEDGESRSQRHGEGRGVWTAPVAATITRCPSHVFFHSDICSDLSGNRKIRRLTTKASAPLEHHHTHTHILMTYSQASFSMFSILIWAKCNPLQPLSLASAPHARLQECQSKKCHRTRYLQAFVSPSHGKSLSVFGFWPRGRWAMSYGK